MFEIRLRRCFAALLQLVEIVLYLFGVKLCGQAPEVKRHRRNVPAVVIKGAGTATQNGNVAFKALKQILKACNFTAGTVKVLVEP